MSGHETIRVLEVEVDAPLPLTITNVKSKGKTVEGVVRGTEEPAEGGGTQDGPTAPQSSGGIGKSWIADDSLLFCDDTLLKCCWKL